MVRILGVVMLLVALYGGLIGTYVENAAPGEPAEKTREKIQGNIINVANQQGRFGLITLGAALVIIVGGIDLSIGAVVGCSAVLFGVLTQSGTHPLVALPIVVCFGALVGMINGLLITKLNLQPFLVTLCGMFIYRGVARLLAGQVSFQDVIKAKPDFEHTLRSMRQIFIGRDFQGLLDVPAWFFWLLALASVVGFFLHFTAFGRYWYAIGHNDLGAKYAGVNVFRHRVAVYMIASMLASFAGVLEFLDSPSILADSGGKDLELYAILGAVLGGCSLRGGEGTAIGMVLGAMVLPLLRSLIGLRGIKDDVIPAVIGLTLLLGTIMDELIRRRTRGRL